MKKRFRRIISLVMLVALAASTVFTGGVANAASPTGTLVDSGPYTGDATYIETFLKPDYLGGGRDGFEIKFWYNSLATKVVNGKEVIDTAIDYNDTLEFLVFDNTWEGWDKTTLGPNGVDKTGAAMPEVGKEYVMEVSFAEIEEKLSTKNNEFGINLQTGGIGNASVEIVFLGYTNSGVKQESGDVLLEGAWRKTADTIEDDFGYMNIVSGNAYISVTDWNIAVGGFTVSDFAKPMVAVTVTYEGITDTIYPQSEVLNSDYVPMVENYPRVSKDGQVTYLTPIPKDTTYMYLAYDTCTVTKVEIYDEAESYATEVYDLTNQNIIDNMGAGWNLGNALDAVTDKGEADETAWGNPVVNKHLFKVVSEAGFKTVRIPVSWVAGVRVNGDSYEITAGFDAILDRVQEVVDMARDYNLFVIINLQHDGSEGVTGQWLDVDAWNQTGIRAAFADVWYRIAGRFKDYDQHLIFESMNEVMEKGNYGTPTASTWNNINTLNQMFVDVVRNVEGNERRFLMVPGYNNSIDQTVSDHFVMPRYGDGSDEYRYEIVVAHIFDPYNFTLNENDNTTELTVNDRNHIDAQFKKLRSKFVAEGIPVVVGEFAAIDKGNANAIAKYVRCIVNDAKENAIGYIYWDNGYDGKYGMALWNRYTYSVTPLGEKLIPILTDRER